MSGKDFYDDDSSEPPAQYYRPDQKTTGDFFAPPPSSAAAPKQPTGSQERVFAEHVNAFGGPPPANFYGAIPPGGIQAQPPQAQGPVMAGSSEPEEEVSIHNEADNAGLLHGQQRGVVEQLTAAPAQVVGEEPPKSYSWYQPEAYRYLFNVDDAELFTRLKKSLFPWSLIPWPPSFLDMIRVNPDIYGPFWITTTVVFLMAAAGNFAEYLNLLFWGDVSNWEPDFNYVSFSALAIYLYNILVPMALWGLSKFLNINLSLLDCLCIYGYALFVFIPVTVVSVAPFEWFRWLMVCLAGAVSIAFLVGNFLRELRANLQYGLFIAAGVGILHAGLTLTFKLYFFHSVTPLHRNSTVTTAPATTTPAPTTTKPAFF